MARPTKYNSDLHPKLVKYIIRDMKNPTLEGIAEELGVSIPTIRFWKKKHPEFLTAIEENNAIIDGEVEDALLKRALGYDYYEVEMDIDPIENKILYTKKKKKHIAGSVAAQAIWLRNRKPKQWREKEESNNEDTDAPNYEDVLKGLDTVADWESDETTDR